MGPDDDTRKKNYRRKKSASLFWTKENLWKIRQVWSVESAWSNKSYPGKQALGGVSNFCQQRNSNKSNVSLLLHFPSFTFQLLLLLLLLREAEMKTQWQLSTCSEEQIDMSGPEWKRWIFLKGPKKIRTSVCLARAAPHTFSQCVNTWHTFQVVNSCLCYVRFHLKQAGRDTVLGNRSHRVPATNYMLLRTYIRTDANSRFKASKA